MLPTDKNNITLFGVNFVHIEEKHFLSTNKTIVLTFLGVSNLIIGLLIQIRIYAMLQKQKGDGTTIVINKLFKVHNIIYMFCYPAFLIYLVTSYYLFPMVDYIGIVGCVFFSHLLHIFAALYGLIFPLTIAIMRYLFVVHSSWTKNFGIHKLVNIIIYLPFLISVLMTLSVQFPVFDFIHGPLNFCKGRFEVFFNPMHPDPITLGRREGKRYCIEAQQWAFTDEIDTNMHYKIFKVSTFVSCEISKNLFYILTMCLPELLLYSFTFIHIIQHNQHVATVGILRHDVVKRRQKQNLLNIYMTCVAWLAQFVANMITVIMVRYMFGKEQFQHHLTGYLALFFNFNLLPFIYIILGNENFKKAFHSKEYLQFIKLLFEC